MRKARKQESRKCRGTPCSHPFFPAFLLSSLIRPGLRTFFDKDLRFEIAARWVLAEASGISQISHWKRGAENYQIRILKPSKPMMLSMRPRLSMENTAIGTEASRTSHFNRE